MSELLLYLARREFPARLGRFSEWLCRWVWNRPVSQMAKVTAKLAKTEYAPCTKAPLWSQNFVVGVLVIGQLACGIKMRGFVAFAKGFGDTVQTGMRLLYRQNFIQDDRRVIKAVAQ